MKQFPLVLILIFIVILSVTELSAKQTIAVLNFDNNSIAQKNEMESLSQGLAAMLTTEMSNVEAFDVVEREKLQALLSEISLGQTGVIDASTAQQVGRLVGARTMLLGGFVHMFGGQIRIDVRIVEVETGLTLKAVEETGKVDKLFEMVEKLTKKIADYFEVKLTGEDKNRLKQQQGSSDFDATLYFSKGVESEDLGIQFHQGGDPDSAKKQYQEALEFYRKALEKDKKFTEARNKIEGIQRKLQEL